VTKVNWDDSSIEGEDLRGSTLMKELVKLRKEIIRRGELHKEELQRVKEKFSVALAKVRYELQTLAGRPPTSRSYFESYP